MIREVVMIDNLDSFTFNLVEAVERLGARVTVLRNTVAAEDALALARERRALILLSPGPGTPEDSGCCPALIDLARGRVPVFGVCLGHQAIVRQAGGAVRRAPSPVHGKSSLLEHDGKGPFAGLSSPQRVARYHSLSTPQVPDGFIVHGEIDGMAMAVSHPAALQMGVQFHPESVLTPAGGAMLRNVLDWAEGCWSATEVK